MFHSLKAVHNKITKDESPHLGLKMVVADELRKHERGGMLKLTATKHSDLLEFLSYFLSILSKLAPHDAVGARFVGSGMLDIKLCLYPDLHTIIGTCKTVKYTAEVEKIVSRNPVELCEE